MREPIDALRAMPYAEYLTSFHWRLTRRLAIEAAGGICQRCFRRGGPMDVHHLSYERLGQERLSDLQAVCRSCHEAIHAWAGNAQGMHTLCGLLAIVLRAPEARTDRLFTDDMPLANQALLEDHQAVWRSASINDGFLARLRVVESVRGSSQEEMHHGG